MLIKIYRQYRVNLKYDVKKFIKPLAIMIEKYQNNYSVLNSILSLIEGILQVEYSKHLDQISMSVI